MSTLQRSSDKLPLLPTACMVVAVGGLAIVVGVLAASASPLAIAMGIGAILGVLLLLAPKANLWLAIVLGLSTGALLSMAGAPATKLQWGIVLLSSMLFIPVLLNILPRPRLPLFMWLYLLFLALSFASSMLHWNAAAPLVAGLKRYYQALGIMLAMAVIPLDWKDDRRLRKTFFWLALIQLPFVLYEAFVLVPIRIALAGADHTSEVTDVIAGTFGANLRVGSPGGEMVAFVLILLAFAWARWREGLLSTFKLGVFIALMLPCVGLGEIKFVAFLFPLIALVLYKEELTSRPGRYLPVMAAVGLVTAAFAYLYFGYFSGTTVTKGFDDMLRYNVAGQGYGGFRLNRTTALGFWWTHQGPHDPVGFFIGHGVGSSYWAPDPTVPLGAIGARYPWFGVALTAASALLWDVGVIGTLLYLSVFVVAFAQAVQLYKKERDPGIRSTLMGIQAALAVFIAFIPYKDSMLAILPFQIVVAVVLGYLAQILTRPGALRAPSPISTVD